MKRMFPEEPIEARILEFVNHMRADMDALARTKTGWFDRGVRSGAKYYSEAYNIVENFILREMKLRRAIKNEKEKQDLVKK